MPQPMALLGLNYREIWNELLQMPDLVYGTIESVDGDPMEVALFWTCLGVALHAEATA